MHTVELHNPKILIRPNQAESTKGKNVVIGEPRSEQKKKSLEASSKNSTHGGQDQKKGARSVQTGLAGPSGGSVLGGHEQRKKDGSAQTSLTGLATGLTGHSESYGKKNLKTPKRKDRVLSNSSPSMRRKELLRDRRSDQIKLKIQIHQRSIVSNRLLMCNKVIILLHHIHLVCRLLHGSGRILAITHLWIIVECICIHALFNILLYIQVMVLLKDRLLLAIIW